MDISSEKRFKELLQKYLDKTISEEEFVEFFTYFDNPEYKDIILEAMEQSQGEITYNAPSHHEIDWDEMYSNITQNNTPPILYRNFKFFLVAAIALLLVSTSLLVYNSYFKDKATAPLLIKNDIQPASKQALLTLDDGTQIALNTVSKGELAIQGSVNILKNEDGSVIYQDKNNNTGTLKYNTLTTPSGGIFTLVLSDGTKVWLNTASTIRYPVAFNKTERRVEINGEVYFEVAKDNNRPFYVNNGNAEIKVLGTHFNVMSYKDDFRSEVTLLEGSIQFAKANNKVLLKPGKQLQYAENNNTIQEVNANIDEVMAWKNNLFVFNNAKLSKVLKDITRWYDLQIKYEGDVPDISYTGVIPRNTKVINIINILERTGDVKFGIDGKVITCSSKLKQ